MRRRFQDVLDASPDDRDRFMENLRRWRDMSPRERESARERWRDRRDRGMRRK
jgi:hypothetical protein